METTNPEVEVEQLTVEDRLAAHYAAEDPEVEQTTPEAEAEAEPVEEQEAEEPAEEAPAEPDTEVVEFEGKQYELPKELKAAVLRQKDYTQKTQEVAEKRKAIEEREAALERIERARETQFAAAVELRGLEQRLEAFKAVDWDGLAATNQAEFMRLDRAQRQLQEQYMHARGQIQQSVQQLTEEEQQSQQQAIAKTREAMAKTKWWTPEVDERIGKFAAELGLTQRQALSFATDPTAYQLLHDAMRYRDLQAGKAVAVKKVSEARPMKVASRAAPQAQANAAFTEARDRLRKTGKGAEEALARYYEQNRKR